MQGESYTRNSESISQNLCIASVLIVFYNGVDLTFSSQALSQSLFWTIRPLGWAVLFSAIVQIITQINETATTSDSSMKWTRLGLSRVVMPLAAVVAISALVIGPLASSTPWRLYFLDRAFLTYWLNLVGVPRFTLPGLFQNSVVPQTVNANLWAMPFLVALCLVALGKTWQPRLVRFLVPLLALTVLIAEFFASSRGIRIFENAGMVRSDGIGLPATALLAGLMALGLEGTRFAGYCTRIPRPLVLLYCIGVGALFARGELELPMMTIAIAIAGPVFVLGDRQAGRDWQLAIPLLPIFFLLSYPLQQLIETRLRDSANAFVLVVAPVLVLIVATLLLSRPLARLVKDHTEILSAWDIRQLSATRQGSGIRGQRLLALILPLMAISIVMILLFLALTLALTPPKVTM